MRVGFVAALAAAVAPAAASAAITVDTFTFTNSGSSGGSLPVGSNTDAFDVSQGTIVTGTSGYNDASRPENAIGGTSATREDQSLVFADGTQQLQTLSFKTASAVTIGGYQLYLAQDGASNGSIRGFDTIGVFGSLDGVSYTDLGSIDLTNPYQDGYGDTTIRVTSTFSAATYQYFQFRGTPFGSTSFSGGRLVELDALAPSATAAVPEPASWAMMLAGFGLTGGALRRRARADAFA